MKNTAIKPLVAFVVLSAFAVVLAGCHRDKHGDVKPVSSAVPVHATDFRNA